MATEDSNKKLAPLLILEILKKYSDKDHLLMREDILSHLEEDYPELHVSVQRKAISSTLALLEDAGYDIEYGPNSRGVYLGDRDLTTYQVQYLTDAIYSSKSINKKDSEELVEAISSCLSNYEKKTLKGLYKSVDVNKTTERNLFLNLDQMQEAINRRKKIRFQYMTYNASLKRVPRYGEGFFYEVSPYYLVNNFGKCYLLCGNDKYHDLSVYRVDYIENLSIEEDKKRTELRALNPKYEGFSISSYINSHVYLFSGEVTTARLLITNPSAITDIKDWFGKNASLEVNPDNTITAEIRSDEWALYYWLLQYGDDIELLSPDSLLVRLSTTYKNMYERYKDVLATHSVKPNLPNQIDTFLRHVLYQHKEVLLNNSLLNVALSGYLNDVNTANYKATTKDKTLDPGKPMDIVLRNNNDPEENYAISMMLLEDEDTTEGVFKVLKEVERLESIASKSVKCRLVVLTGNKGYVRKTLSDTQLTAMLSVDHELPKGCLKVDQRLVNLKHHYPILWQGITQLQNKDNDSYNYFTFEVKA